MIKNNHENIETMKISSSKGSWWNFLKLFLLFVVMFYLIRFFLFIPFVVVGTSMEPTLQHNDYLIVDRFHRFKALSVGEIIIFYHPTNLNQKLVKRIMRIESEGGKNKFWVIGDNKKHSIDSRQFGYIKKEQIIGRVAIRLWPLSEITWNFAKE